MVILDTNIIIDHLRTKNKTRESILLQFVRRQPNQILAVSILSVQELYEGQSTRKKSAEQALLAVLSPLHVLPYTFSIAQQAGCLARDLHQPIELADAAIAATALEHNASLLTLNTKDFQEIAELELLPL
ncbi:MAG: PIN domain-containing protein [Patescibacteria group bacterium]